MYFYATYEVKEYPGQGGSFGMYADSIEDAVKKFGEEHPPWKLLTLASEFNVNDIVWKNPN